MNLREYWWMVVFFGIIGIFFYFGWARHQERELCERRCRPYAWRGGARGEMACECMNPQGHWVPQTSTSGKFGEP